MDNKLNEAIEILSRTPKVIGDLLLGLDKNWLRATKREGAYTPSEVVGHLISNEQTNWIPRMKVILSNGTEKRFAPFDREGFDKNQSLENRIQEFTNLREKNILILKQSFHESDLSKTAIHPSLGEVNLGQLLATWVVHDLTHLFQIVEVLALQYKETVGPWYEFLKILRIP